MDRAVGAFYAKPWGRELDVDASRFEEPGGDARALLDDLIRGLRHHDGGHPQRPRRVRAAADHGDVGVTGDQSDLCVLDAEPLDEELREARLVPLAGRERTEH